MHLYRNGGEKSEHKNSKAEFFTCVLTKKEKTVQRWAFLTFLLINTKAVSIAAKIIGNAIKVGNSGTEGEGALVDVGVGEGVGVGLTN